ncbi:MAG: glutathione S-transferase family protein [Pseudomonadota bacterium]
MPLLKHDDVQTTEVFNWKGVHLLHFMGSSCSQKTRIFLNAKGIDWTSRPVDVPAHENYGAWYLGINPRGLVPTLVHDGQVIIESNDIIEHLENVYPDPPLIPRGQEQLVHELLAHEDDLHLDLRTLSMRYVFGPGAGIRSPELLEQYESSGSGRVAGEADEQKAIELAFFKDLASNNGITDDQVRSSVRRFHVAFSDLEQRLSATKYVLGDSLSIVDIAWYIYAARLRDGAYPLHSEHPLVGEWFDALDSREDFRREVQAPPPLVAAREAMHEQQHAAGQSMAQVAGLGGR